jgi:putative aldouronate transport system permease protein
MNMTRSFSRYRFSQRVSQALINVVLLLMSFIFLLPLMVVVSASFSDEQTLLKLGYSILPQNFSLAAYYYLLLVPGRLIRAYGVTIFVTISGTLMGLFIMAMLAYSLSRPEFKWRKPLSFFVIFTMLFNGGLVPTYLLITQGLHLKDNILVLILPYLVIPWFVFILRSFFANLPQEIIECARVDGASELRIFLQLVMPLSTPALATVGLFMILMYWNDWWLSLLYINDPNLFPLQYLLFSIMRNAEFLTSNENTGLLMGIELPTQTLRMAMVVIAMGPIAIVFLALQRYFIRGILIGSVKG